MFESKKLTTSSLGSFALMFPQTRIASRPVKRPPSVMDGGAGGGGGTTGATGTLTFTECVGDNVLSEWTVVDGLVTKMSNESAKIKIRACSGGSS